MSALDAKWAGAIVVLCDGKRLGWKIHRGVKPEAMERFLDGRYFGGHAKDECCVAGGMFADPDAFSRAEAWAASFPAHPDERGSAPVDTRGAR